jgi:hypothetical protein
MNFLSDLGISPVKASVQLLIFIVVLLPAMLATLRAARLASSTAMPFWIACIWLIPILGPAAAFVCVRRTL